VRLMLRRTAAVLIWSVLSICGCSQSSQPVSAAERGRQVYMANCTVCHNPNPNEPGSQGPPIAGSSRQLVEARVLHAAYPPGYAPKRATHAMVALPHLASEIENLTAFLAEGKTPAS
jgi:mono/diheme cytochrome c family protein